MLFQKNWPFTKLINYHLFKLYEEGIIKNYEKKWFHKNSHCGQKGNAPSQTRIKTISMLFGILFVGISASLIIMIVEMVLGNSKEVKLKMPKSAPIPKKRRKRVIKF